MKKKYQKKFIIGYFELIESEIDGYEKQFNI